MEEEKIRIWNVSKKLFAFLGTILLLFLLIKFAVYFMPFFIAGIIAIIIEPIIKFNMNKLKMSRRVSSIIVVLITILLFIGIIIFGGVKLVGGLTYLSKNITSEFSSYTDMLKAGLNSLSDNLREYIPSDILENGINSITNAFSNLRRIYSSSSY
jgi:predicted PurR-regulated permease PerM